MLLGIADHEPQDCNKFFKRVVKEFEDLGEEGMEVENETYKAYLHLFTADLVAKKKVNFSFPS